VAGVRQLLRSRALWVTGVFLLGLSCGVVLQRAYPVGRMLRSLRGYGSLAAAPEVPRVEVPFRVLAAQRVMVVLVLGQSNAANYGERRQQAQPGVYNFYDGSLYQAQDPLLGATGDGGSIWTRFGDQVLAQGGYDAVVLVPFAVGGSSVAQWTVGGKLHDDLLHVLAEVDQAGLAITHIVWQQGEADARKATRTTEYLQQFNALVASIRAQGVTAPVYVARASRCREHRSDPAIRRAQQLIGARTPGVVAGPDLDQLGWPTATMGVIFRRRGWRGQRHGGGRPWSMMGGASTRRRAKRADVSSRSVWAGARLSAFSGRA
jgi:hypothetical protein